MRKAPPVHEFQPIHTEGHMVGPAPADLGPGRYKNIQQILIGAIIIGAVAFLMIEGFYKARRPAYMADCIGRLHVLAQAFDMYSTDHAGYLPPAASWRWAVSDYVDAVGGQSEEVGQVRRSAKPRGFSSPMRCLGNRTATPISYFYVDPVELRISGKMGDQPEAPLLVDELHHPKVIALQQDSSCARLDRGEWLKQRRDDLQIARRPDWQNTFAYTSTRPKVAPTPAGAPWRPSWMPSPYEAPAGRP